MSDTKPNRFLRRLMAWIAFAVIVAVIGFSLFSDELANQTLIMVGVGWMAIVVLLWYIEEKHHGKFVELISKLKP